MILVTGGTGLVGSHLLYRLLLENSSVRAIYQRTSDLNAVKNVFRYYTTEYESVFERVRWVEAGLNDLPALQKAFEEVSLVYHCAAMVSFLSSDYQRMRKINIEGTTNIVNLSISQKVEKLCFVSSVAAIENNLDGSPSDENANWNSTLDKSGYAISKYGGEMEVWRASQEGLPVIIVNPGVILGSGFWHKGSGKMFTRVYRGLKFYSEGLTGFVDVADVAEIMTRLMHSTIQNERFILVAENTTYKKLLFLIADALQRPRPKIRITPWLSGILWRLEYLKSKIALTDPLLTRHTARSATSIHPYSNKKIKDALGYEFRDLNDSVTRIAGDFKRHLED